MFVPLYDVNALKHIKLQYVTLSLIAINTIIWLVTDLGADPLSNNRTNAGLGYIPLLFNSSLPLPPELYIVPKDFTYLTYAFLHGDFWHLAGNMLFLWVFGDNVEDAMGHIKFLLFYILCAVAAAWFHGFLDPQSNAPLIGASGAISGVVASYFILHPKVRVWVLILWRVPVPLPAFIPLLFWILQQFFMLVVDHDSNVSWAAHAGGIVAGLVLTPVLKRWGVPLFDRTIVSPKAVEHKETLPAATDNPQKTTPHWGR